eukprot:TRINITY_DN6635_c0_g1_i1.p1 TRINITY_DN6635_c0_g1~~TRINITY_DN6635_c0_g1_i1.p1  ORF type:complete len:680 (-),score=150.59 TRINITY_DN6635_c0_g1_i1:1183-3222(-)
MKFMKLGSKPDIFLSDGNIRYVATELISDIIINVEDTKFYLHKFPLLSKSHCLQCLVAKANEAQRDEIGLPGFPGGPMAFEACAKFCYGIAITLNAYNVVAVRCAAEYLGMTETMEKGNLVYKLEVFFSTSIFRSWKDSIIVLQSTKAMSAWVEDLKITGRCIDSIATKTSVDPSQVDWSFTYTREKPLNTQPRNDTAIHNGKQRYVPKDWWVEDICELDIDLFQHVIAAIKSKGRMSHELIGEALKVYTLRWLPGNSKCSDGRDKFKIDNGPISLDHSDGGARQRELVETIIGLLPPEKGSVSCSFLLKLLKAACILGIDSSIKIKLAKRIGSQLEEASVRDLLIPSMSDKIEHIYDVDLVHCILEHFLIQNHSSHESPEKGELDLDFDRQRASSPEDLDKGTSAYDSQRTSSSENLEFSEGGKLISATSKLNVAKLIDGYLAEIACDKELPLAKFISLAELTSDFPRPYHDSLYRAIDIYLKEHANLTKSERKHICKLMDCKKLSMDASMHAAQNDRLPLRVVVQVLFFEHMRSSMTNGGLLMNGLPPTVRALMGPQENVSQGSSQSTVNLEDEWDTGNDDLKTSQGDLASVKIRTTDVGKEQNVTVQEEGVKSMKSRGIFLLPSRSKKIFSKFWSNRANSENRSSETSGSSLSPVSVNPGDTKSSTSSRQRRHSIS